MERGRAQPHSAQSQGCCECCGLRFPHLHRARAHCRLLAQSLMAGSCEISNIFSNYISAMYQPDEVQPTLDMVGHLGDDGSLGLSLPNSQPLAQGTGRTGGAVVAAQGCQHARQQQGSAVGLEEHCKVLVPLGQVNSLHYASVSRGVCWLKRLLEETLGGTMCGCLEHNRCIRGMRDSLPSSLSTSQGTGCQGSPGQQFGSTVRVLGVPLHWWDHHGMALGEARGKDQQSRADPSTDGTMALKPMVCRVSGPCCPPGQEQGRARLVTQEQALSSF